MGAPEVLRALCAQIDRVAPSPEYRSSFLTDAAMAANRLGWPEIAEALLDEVRDLGGGTYRVFNAIIEELGDPERMIRQYLKWLPTREELARDRYYASDIARSLARAGLEGRLHEVVDPLVARVEDGSRRSEDPLLRFHLLKDMASGLQTLGLRNESLAFMERALEDLRQVRDPVQKEQELGRLDKDLRVRFENGAQPVLPQTKTIPPSKDRVSRIEAARQALLQVPSLPPQEAVPLLEAVFDEMESPHYTKKGAADDLNFLLKAVAAALFSADWGEQTIPLYRRWLSSETRLNYRAIHSPGPLADLAERLTGAPLGERRLAVYDLIVDFGSAGSSLEILRILPTSNLGDNGFPILERIWNHPPPWMNRDSMFHSMKGPIASMKFGDVAEGFFDQLLSDTGNPLPILDLIDSSRLSPAARMRLFSKILEKTATKASLSRLIESLAKGAGDQDSSVLIRKIIARNEGLMARDVRHDGLKIADELEKACRNEESLARLRRDRISIRKRQKARGPFLKLLDQRSLPPSGHKDRPLLRDYVDALRKVRDPFERNLLHDRLGEILLILSGSYPKAQQTRLGIFFEMYLEGLPPLTHSALRAEAIVKAFTILDRLAIGYEWKKQFLAELLEATKGIVPIDRVAGAIRRIADLISDRSNEGIHKSLYHTHTLWNIQAVKLLKQCLNAAIELPPEHPATNPAIRHIGRHLAWYGVESGYPREALTDLDREFLQDPYSIK